MKHSINRTIRSIKKQIITFNINNVYLATDDYSAYDKIKKALPDINLIQYTKPGNFGGKPIHAFTKDKDKLIYNCLLDIYMILMSNIFIRSKKSGLSKWISNMINIKKKYI